MEAKVYNKEGKEVGEVKLPENLFGLKWNADLVNQVVSSVLSSQRKPVAHAKSRGEVRGGGKKPWKQKGTGRSRHGSSRSPIWVGGGTTHGPRNDKNYDRKVNKKMKTKALFTVLSAKLRDGELLFVDDLGLKDIKTKAAGNILSSLSKIAGYEKIVYKKGNRAYVALPQMDTKVLKSFRNIKSVAVTEARSLSPVDVLKYKYLVLVNPEVSVGALTSRVSLAGRASKK